MDQEKLKRGLEAAGMCAVVGHGGEGKIPGEREQPLPGEGISNQSSNVRSRTQKVCVSYLRGEKK